MNKVCRTEDGAKEFVISDAIGNYLTAFGITIQIEEKTEDLTGTPCYRCILAYNNQKLKIEYDSSKKTFAAWANGYPPLIEYLEPSLAHGEIIKISGETRVNINFYQFRGRDEEKIVLSARFEDTRIYNILTIIKTKLGNAIITFECVGFDSIEPILQISKTIEFGSEHSPQDYLDMLKEQLNSINHAKVDKTWVDLMLCDSRLLEHFKIIVDSMPKTFSDAYESAYESICNRRDREVADVMGRYDGEFITLAEAASNYLYQKQPSEPKGIHR